MVSQKSGDRKMQASNESTLLDGTTVARLTAPAAPGCAAQTGPDQRVRVSGKGFQLNDAAWYLKGVTYGPFAPRGDRRFLPNRLQICRDLRHIRELGGN